MPPIAAAIGSAAWRGDASSPASASRLISSPTRRKKTAIRPSLIHWCRVSDSACPPTAMAICRRQQAVVGSGPRGVGHDERGARAGDEQGPAGRFGSEELLKRTGRSRVRRLDRRHKRLTGILETGSVRGVGCSIPAAHLGDIVQAACFPDEIELHGGCLSRGLEYFQQRRKALRLDPQAHRLLGRPFLDVSNNGLVALLRPHSTPEATRLEARRRGQESQGVKQLLIAAHWRHQRNGEAYHAPY